MATCLNCGKRRTRSELCYECRKQGYVTAVCSVCGELKVDWAPCMVYKSWGDCHECGNKCIIYTGVCRDCRAKVEW